MPLQYTYNPDGSIKSVVSVNPDGTPKVAAGDEYPIIIKYRDDGSMQSAVSQPKTPGYVSKYTPLPVLGYPLPNTKPKKKYDSKTIADIMQGKLIGTKEETMDTIGEMLRTPALLTALDRQLLESQMETIKRLDNPKYDAITGQTGKRDINDFKTFLRKNKEGF